MTSDFSGHDDMQSSGFGRVFPREFPLSNQWAVELIASVLRKSDARQVQLHHLAPIGSLLYRAYWIYRQSPADVHRRVRAAVRLLEDGMNKDGAVFGEVFSDTIYRLGKLQQQEHNLQEDTWEAPEDDPERRFRPLLRLYSFTYERYYRVLAAPYVVAFALEQGESSPLEKLDNDGRVPFPAVEEIESGRGMPDKSLRRGLQNHLRNSIAHDRFDILSEDRISMWDEYRGNMTWGPKEFDFYELREEVYKLSMTCATLLLGIALFNIANGRLMQARGWFKARLEKKRNDVLKSELEDMAQRHGFTVETVSQEGDAVSIRVSVLGRTMPNQTSEILSGGDGVPLKFLQDIRTDWAPTWKQAYGFLQMTYELHGAYDSVELRVEGPNGEDYGSLDASRAIRARLLKGEDPESLRAKMDSDTLSDEQIPVVHRSVPRPA